MFFPPINSFFHNSVPSPVFRADVHRDQIARKSKESYERILGEAYTYGIFIGDEKDIDKRAVFSTVQTMRNHLNDGMFAKNAFDPTQGTKAFFLMFGDCSRSVSRIMC